MPKNRKTRKQKIRASIKHSSVTTTAAPTSSQHSFVSQQAVKLPEKLSSEPAFLQSTMGSLHTHAYLKKELLQTTILSCAIIVAELLLFVLIRNHLIVLPFVSY